MLEGQIYFRKVKHLLKQNNLLHFKKRAENQCNNFYIIVSGIQIDIIWLSFCNKLAKE